MNNMRYTRIFVSTLLVLLTFFYVGQAYATVSLYLVDDPYEYPIGTIEVEATLYDLNTTDGVSALIQYSTNDSDFYNFGSRVSETIDKIKPIYFRLELFDSSNSSMGYDITGDLTFNSLEDSFYGLDAYASATIFWGDFRIEFLSSSSDDNFAAIPIPGAVLLFTTGLAAAVLKKGKVLGKNK